MTCSAQRAPANTARIPAGLVALALGGFGIGLTEFVIAGLLTEVATDLRVSVPAAGGLVSGYAVGVVLGALSVTLALVSRPPKRALLVLLALFVLGNALSAWSPDYAVMLLGRVVAALCHGGFFGIGSVLAARLVPAGRQASAIAVMFAGLTLANVLGVPAGTALGQHLGWRATFVAIAVLGLLAMAGIAALVPALPAHHLGPLRAQFRTLLTGQVLASILLTVLVFGGMFGAFSYVEPLLRQVSGYPAAAIPWLLVLFGAGLCAGNLLGGRAADRGIDATLLVLALALPVVLAALALLAADRVAVAVALAVLGAVGFATVPPLQLRVLRHAPHATVVASAVNIAAFNLGNALGVHLGGVALHATADPVAPVWTGALLSTAGALLATGAILRTRKAIR